MVRLDVAALVIEIGMRAAIRRCECGSITLCSSRDDVGALFVTFAGAKIGYIEMIAKIAFLSLLPQGRWGNLFCHRDQRPAFRMQRIIIEIWTASQSPESGPRGHIVATVVPTCFP